jgi:indole-3-glycerol phosphate synthase/phosphoribosylanthranilate isomerase
MRNILADIVRQKKDEVQFRKSKLPLSALERTIELCDRPSFEKVLRGSYNNGVPKKTFVLEVKPASPSCGALREGLHEVNNLNGILSCYHEYASALSVLTDTTFFQGSFELLTSVVHNTTLPVLCKDFILDPYQVFEAYHAGASAVLLIAKILMEDELTQFFKLIKSLGMTPVVEIQNEDELHRALLMDPSIILINNRNLESLAVSLDTTLDLAPHIPDGIICISASGIACREHIDHLSTVCSSFLIGSAFMRVKPKLLPKTLKEMLHP